MRHKIEILGFAVLLFGLPGCGRQQQAEPNADMEHLYRGMCNLTESYIDSMRESRDSASLLALMERYDARITDLNFSVAPDTDYRLAEGKNDTIAILVDSIRRVFDKRMHFFAHTKNSPDTIPADSINLNQ